MSRQATAQAAKKEQKAAIASKNAEKERLAGLGINAQVAKAMEGDRLLCTGCGATSMGPTVCECKGGNQRPTGDYDTLPQLSQAAQARMAQAKLDKKKEIGQQCNKTRDAIASERAKNKDARGGYNLDEEFQGNDVECLEVYEFPVGKFGFNLEKTAISKINDPPNNAADLGVKAGWIIYKINGTIVEPATKEAVVKEASKCMKLGPVKFTFRVPVLPDYYHCSACDKFQDNEQFDPTQLSSKGPGKQMCYLCAEVADMGGDDDY